MSTNILHFLHLFCPCFSVLYLILMSIPWWVFLFSQLAVFIGLALTWHHLACTALVSLIVLSSFCTFQRYENSPLYIHLPFSVYLYCIYIYITYIYIHLYLLSIFFLNIISLNFYLNYSCMKIFFLISA